MTAKRFLALMLCVGLLLSLSACSGKKQGGAPPEDKPVVVLQGVDARTLDPQQSGSLTDLNVELHIFEPLVEQADDMTLVPALATEWKIQDDKLTWVFKLRQGVKFSNGEPFNAEAVKFSFDRALAEGSPARTSKGNTLYLLNNLALERVDVIDEYTVAIKTKRPNPVLPSFLPEFYMLAPKHYGQLPPDQAALKPVGTGQYVLKEWKKDEQIVLEANPNYWGEKPAIKTIIFRPVPEAASRIAELKTGGADLIVNVPPDRWKEVDDLENAHLATVKGGRRIFIGFNFLEGSNPVIRDVRLRQAFNYAVNFDAIRDNLLNGVGERMATNVNPPWQNPNVKPYPYDPEKAKQLLADLGFNKTNDKGLLVNSRGETLKLTLWGPQGRYMRDKEIVQAVGADLRKIGVDVNVQILEWSVYVPKLLAGELKEMYMIGSGSNFEGQADISDLQKDSVSNYGHWKNDDFEALWSQLVVEFDAVKRRELLYRMQEITAQDPPYVFLWFQHDAYGVSDRLDWKPLPNERIRLTDAKLKK